MNSVNQIWVEYDDDENGWLDKEEMRAFVQDMLVECGLITNYTDNDFERVFTQFDTDGDGKISKPEMLAFIKRVSGT